MEQYDYRDNGDIMDEVSAEIDKLTTCQMKKIHEAIEAAKVDEKTQQIEQNVKWFQLAILPVLKRYAEKENALLAVNNSGGIFEAMFHYGRGFSLDNDEALMRMAMFAANSFGVEVQDGQVILTLIYDCDRLK